MIRFYEGMTREAGTEFSASLRLPPDLNFPDGELCVLLGNLLENAVEAAARVQTGRRFITLRANVRDERLGLVMENSFGRMVRMKNNRFYSSKREGFGLEIQSVQAVAKRRGGLCDFSPEGDVFRAGG